MACFWKFTVSQALCFGLANGEIYFFLRLELFNIWMVVTMGKKRSSSPSYLWQNMEIDCQVLFRNISWYSLWLFLIDFKWLKILYQFDCQNAKKKKKIVAKISIEYFETEFSIFFKEYIFHLVGKRWIFKINAQRTCADHLCSDLCPRFI